MCTSLPFYKNSNIHVHDTRQTCYYNMQLCLGTCGLIYVGAHKEPINPTGFLAPFAPMSYAYMALLYIILCFMRGNEAILNIDLNTKFYQLAEYYGPVFTILW